MLSTAYWQRNEHFICQFLAGFSEPLPHSYQRTSNTGAYFGRTMLSANKAAARPFRQ